MISSVVFQQLGSSEMQPAQDYDDGAVWPGQDGGEGGKSKKPKAKHYLKLHGNASATGELWLLGDEAVGGQ